MPPEKAARRLHLAPERFTEVLPRLIARGFPAPDPDTGCFALEAIDQWRKLRTPSLFGLTPAAPTAQSDAANVGSLGERFATKKHELPAPHPDADAFWSAVERAEVVGKQLAAGERKTFSALMVEFKDSAAFQLNVDDDGKERPGLAKATRQQYEPHISTTLMHVRPQKKYSKAHGGHGS